MLRYLDVVDANCRADDRERFQRKKNGDKPIIRPRKIIIPITPPPIAPARDRGDSGLVVELGRDDVATALVDKVGVRDDSVPLVC